MTDRLQNKGLIRMALMATAFVTLTIVLVVFQPGSPRHAETEFSETTTSVTRVASAPEDLGGVSGTLSANEPTFSAPQTNVVAVPTPTQPTSMRDMTFVAISNLKSATTGETPAPGEPGSLLHSVVRRSIATTPSNAPAPEPVQAIPTSQVVLETTPATPVKVASAGTYLVQPGDTLVSIARTLYGNVNMASVLFIANTNVMSRPDSLRPGMVLELPVQ